MFKLANSGQFKNSSISRFSRSAIGRVYVDMIDRFEFRRLEATIHFVVMALRDSSAARKTHVEVRYADYPSVIFESRDSKQSIAVVEGIGELGVGGDCCVGKRLEERHERGFLVGGQIQAAGRTRRRAGGRRNAQGWGQVRIVHNT